MAHTNLGRYDDYLTPTDVRKRVVEFLVDVDIEAFAHPQIKPFPTDTRRLLPGDPMPAKGANMYAFPPPSKTHEHCAALAVWALTNPDADLLVLTRITAPSTLWRGHFGTKHARLALFKDKLEFYKAQNGTPIYAGGTIGSEPTVMVYFGPRADDFTTVFADIATVYDLWA